MADPEDQDAVVDESGEDEPTKEEGAVDESAKFFSDMTPEKRAAWKDAAERSGDYDPREVVGLAAKQLDAEKKAEQQRKTEEQQMWEERKKEKGDSGEEDGDEPMTKAEFREARKHMTEEFEAKTDKEKLAQAHAFHLQEYGVTDDVKAFSLRKSVEAYMQEVKCDVASAYQAVCGSLGVKTKGAEPDDGIDKAVKLSRVASPRSGRGNSPPPKPEEPKFMGPEHLEAQHKKYGVPQ